MRVTSKSSERLDGECYRAVKMALKSRRNVASD
jgi:hypothetical protein